MTTQRKTFIGKRFWLYCQSLYNNKFYTIMEEVYLLYETDEWLSKSSQVLMGVFTGSEQISDGVRELVKKRIENFRDDEFEELEETQDRILEEVFCNNGLQTQGYTVNILVKSVEPNRVDEIY